ncbi:MAG: HNH endonuclease [Christensenellales bacterium]
MGELSVRFLQWVEGWINADYIHTCDEQAYYATEDKQEDGRNVTLQSNAAIAQTEEPIGLDGLENDSEIVQQRNETDSSLNIFKQDKVSIQIPKRKAEVWLAGIGIIFALIVAGVLVERRRLFAVRVEKRSKRLKALREINSRYQFDQKIEEQYEHWVYLKTKQQYDQFSFERYMRGMMETNFENHEKLIRQIQYNRKQMQRYQSELSALPDYMSAQDARRNKVPYSFCKRVERKLSENELKNAVVSPNFLYCMPKPTGRMLSKESDIHINSFLTYTTTKQEMMWRQTRQGNAEYERSKMNSSIRYDILKRDHFRCVICGRSAEDGVKLHVDHIIPVSKGGKTEYSNLRTLCDTCNFGKRDKYDISGWN